MLVYLPYGAGWTRLMTNWQTVNMAPAKTKPEVTSGLDVMLPKIKCFTPSWKLIFIANWKKNKKKFLCKDIYIKTLWGNTKYFVCFCIVYFTFITESGNCMPCCTYFYLTKKGVSKEKHIWYVTHMKLDRDMHSNVF